ncbi:tetratricopeptide repeat protein [Flavobacterium sp.]|uniref:tetratricopeptide repeat protein n=1 Tax=Flavobacterium sp. TaxID=239 RepID=UPI00261554E9|nr:tetratricopeptide repeat protein [Flavobacterium sp.]MDG2432794.1 tetratricopeptide repeat protein [Flavobacterium sp.]
MNVTEYTQLMNKPNAISETQTLALENVLDEFPYFQSARALRLKGLYNQNSFKYNFALKVTAAHTTDRSILFDFITSESFTAIQKAFFEKKKLELLNITVVDSQEITASKEPNTLERSILSSIKEASPAEANEQKIAIEAKLDIGTPIAFSENEKHSFQEWLQLSRIQPIVREEEPIEEPKTTLIDEVKKKKEALINKFIETSPKIAPVKNGTPSPAYFDINKDDNSSLMTETLAKVYLEQKKYQKAIQAYEILILKYPEKSSFFADRISDIKILQQNNN